MENLSTDNLMRLQVEQLEKEKKELNEKMRIASKRVDHIERAYRKDERPLLAHDYDIQQANDKVAHEAAQKTRIEAARLAHQQDTETKKRLVRIMDDWKAYRALVGGKRSEEYAKRQAQAQRKIEEEKAKRRAAILREREEERLRLEEEERIEREKEEEERRVEAGKLALVVITLQSDLALLQPVLRKKSASKPRKKLKEKPPKLRNARKKRRQLLCVSSVMQIGKLQ